MMQVNGIIAEYNPFHNGHKYQLEESLRRTRADYTIVVMSGNFVQRGAPALADKSLRAEMALRCGADLVLELPVLYATSSAEFFAAGAVSLLDQLGVVSHLCFGSECGDAAQLQSIAALLLNETEMYQTALKTFLHQGLSYPKARARALAQCYPSLEGHGDFFSAPNNILGIEYCKALQKRQSNILPVSVRRSGPDYHDRRISGPFCSAFALRQAIYEGHCPEQLCTLIPAEAEQLLTTYLASHAPIRSDDFSSILYYKLLLEKEGGYENYLDVSEDLSNRIRNQLSQFISFGAFCDLLKTKELTYTRISRCLLHILLDLKQNHMKSGQSMDYVPYARVLGFRRSASSLLRAIKENSAIPLVTKLVNAEKTLGADALRLLKQDILCNEIYQGVAAACSSRTPINEFTVPIVML